VSCDAFHPPTPDAANVRPTIDAAIPDKVAGLGDEVQHDASIVIGRQLRLAVRAIAATSQGADVYHGCKR
jgi:hypothetical protein